MNTFVPPELDWVAHGLLLSLALGLLFAVAVGLLMLGRPETLFRINQRWSRWVDTTGEFKALDSPRMVDRWLYRYHRLVGVLITLGAAFVLWQWTVAYQREGLFRMLGERWERPELSWLVTAGEWLVVALHTLILVIGLIVIVRPSLLKAVEGEGNRWREADTQALDRTYSTLERAMQLRPRLAGLLLLVAGTWCLAGLLPLVLEVLRR